MNLIGYSPWQDAAQYGQGLGNTLAKILFELPALRARERREEREFGLREREVGAREQMYKQHGELYSAQAQNAPLQLQLKQDAQEARQLLDAVKARKMEADILNMQEDNKRLGELATSLMTNRAGQNALNAQRVQLMPGEFQSRMSLRNAQIDALNDPVRQFMPLLRGAAGEIADPLDPSSDPVGNLYKAFEQSQQRFNPPAPMGREDMRMGPPDRQHRIRVRHKATGRTGWGTIDDAKDPAYEVLGEG